LMSKTFWAFTDLTKLLRQANKYLAK